MGPLSYAGAGGLAIHLEAGPVWSEDSERVAILERQIDSGRLAVTTISTGGQVVTVPVPGQTRDDPTLTWIETRVAVGSGSNAVVVEPARRVGWPVDVESAAILQKAARARQKALDDRKAVDVLVGRLGGTRGCCQKPN